MTGGGNMRAIASVTVCWVFCMFLTVGASASGDDLVRLTSPLERLESLQGAAIVRKAGQTLVLTLPSQDGHGRWFRVEAFQGAQLPDGFRAASAQVHYW